jgi:glutathione synthase
LRLLNKQGNQLGLSLATLLAMSLDWPPPLAKGQIEALSLEANTFALSKGLSYLPKPGTGTDISSIPVSAIHAPYTLLPTPFPRQLFRFAQRLQPFYNVLYSRIASDFDLLDRIMGAEVGVGRVHFTGTLWWGWKDLRDLGEDGILQASFLCLFLSAEIQLPSSILLATATWSFPIRLSSA